MGKAIDLVIAMENNKRLNAERQGDMILGGFQNAIANQQKNQMLAMTQRKNSIDELLATSKIRTLSTEAMLNNAVTDQLNGVGNQSGSGALITGLTSNGINVSFPEAKAKEKATVAASTPLSGDTARMFSGAKQGLNNISAIYEFFDFQENNGEITSKDFNKKLDQLSSERVAQKLGIGSPTSNINILSLGMADVVAKKFGTTSENGRKLVLLFSTLAENNLRARTGAQAPEPEKVAEELRSILGSIDTPANALDKLKESENFLRETAKQIRPNEKLPKTGILQSFKTEAEARAAGFGSGDRVIIGGRKGRLD